MDIFGLGKDRWNLVSKAANKIFVPGHKLTGKPSNNKRKFKDLFGELLVVHFSNLRKEAGPIATRFVHEETGEVTTRDDCNEAEYLDASLSERACYQRFCGELGIDATTDNARQEIFVPLNKDNEVKVPSWFAYQQYWKIHHPFLWASQPAQISVPIALPFTINSSTRVPHTRLTCSSLLQTTTKRPVASPGKKRKASLE